MKRFHSGFTIIESIVVIAILVILTMLVVALFRFRTKPQFPKAPPPASIQSLAFPCGTAAGMT